MKTFKNVVKKSAILTETYYILERKYYQYFLSDKKLIKSRFKKRLDRRVDLNNPQKFNDKLQWLKLNWHDELATSCADKYDVRKIVGQRIGESYLNELIDVYESVEEIDLEKLPDQFVLKGTHGSGFNIICTDKSKLNWLEEKKVMNRWLSTNYYYKNREWVYRDIKPRIICEKYLEELASGDLRDYKVFCFNGKPKLIQVDFDRQYNHRRNFYDLNWNFIDVEIKYPNDPNEFIPRPIKLTEILKLSEKLSKGFPHVRVDFYIVENNIKFGELTFFHESGMGKFSSEEFELKMGSWLKLPQNDK